MSRFKKLSHSLWHCPYHLVWTPRYRIRILEGEGGQEAASCVRILSEQIYNKHLTPPCGLLEFFGAKAPYIPS